MPQTWILSRKAPTPQWNLEQSTANAVISNQRQVECLFILQWLHHIPFECALKFANAYGFRNLKSGRAHLIPSQDAVPLYAGNGAHCYSYIGSNSIILLPDILFAQRATGNLRQVSQCCSESGRHSIQNTRFACAIVANQQCQPTANIENQPVNRTKILYFKTLKSHTVPVYS